MRGFKKKSQVSLELTASLIVLFILIGGIVKIFLWVNKRMVLRQELYEQGRVDAGSAGAEPVDESLFPKLNIFGEK